MLPPGRKPIKTVHYYDTGRLKIFGFLKKQIAEGRQVNFVYPLIHESEKLDLKHLMDGYESISREFPLPHYTISGFFRVHQFHLVNLDHILRFEKVDGGHLVMSDNSIVPVSSRKREELFKLFEKM